jgi:hypothetical protein
VDFESDASSEGVSPLCLIEIAHEVFAAAPVVAIEQLDLSRLASEYGCCATSQVATDSAGARPAGRRYRR